LGRGGERVRGDAGRGKSACELLTVTKRTGGDEQKGVLKGKSCIEAGKEDTGGERGKSRKGGRVWGEGEGGEEDNGIVLFFSGVGSTLIKNLPL